MMVDLFGMESTFHDNGNMHLEGYDAQNYFRGLQSKERKSEMVSYSEDEDDSAIKKVKITITNQIVGKAHVSGFSHEKGRTKDIFEVPLYKLIIEGTDAEGIKRSEEYGVIRFGVQQRKTGGKATVVGRTKEESFTIRSWNPTYLSGLRGATPGAWRITGGFLLHDGADAPLKDAWGAIGCIEVCGSFNDDQDNFTRLNWLIRSWSGATEATKNTKAQYNKVATSGILIIYFQYSSKPPLKKI
ncbi:MAG: hypothetical protein IPJ82_22665 [Lewinellaceae bacterium]|nr:hypothetical protein [Lewinellaceae bacterium]